jgi:hypothetical protein
MKRIAIVAACLSLFLNGCQNQNNGMVKKSVADELEQRNLQLRNELLEVKSERNQLKERINVLTSLGGKVTAKDVYDLQSIRIGRYSGFYDRDNDGKKETLIIYVQPVDVNGDVVKAIGDVEIELWDLNAKKEPMIKQWKVGPEELSKSWYSVLTSNYRLIFDAATIAAETKGDLTIRVKFTDHLSGVVFKTQYAITSR